MPPFIPQTPPLFDPQFPAPYKFQQVDLRMYLVVADREKLQQVCDRFLNDVAKRAGRSIRFKPIGLGGQSIVQLEVVTYGRMVSLAEGWEQIGYTTQKELLFAIPLVMLKRRVPIDVGLFAPYLFVDNDWSLICGRDVVGNPKSLGRFKHPNQHSTEVDVQAIARFGPDQQARRYRLVDIRWLDECGGAAAVELREASSKDWPFGPVDELYGPQGIAPTSEDVLLLLRERAGHRFTWVALKQFRDLVDFRSACYQELTSCDLVVDVIRESVALPATEIRLQRYDSLRIGEQLGLEETNGKLELVPLLPPFCFDLDFRLANPKSLGTA